MNQLSILSRHLCILRHVQPPFLYPDKKQMLERMQQEQMEAASFRTIERDLQDIDSYYGIRVRYSSRHKGYYLYQPEDEDLSDFRQFFNLLERCERLTFLTHSADALSTGKYLLLEDNPDNLGLKHMPVLWAALRSQRQIFFQYHAFQAEAPKNYQVDPLLLLEYRNRWYLAAWDPLVNSFKTFGLERMLEPSLTDTIVMEDRRSQFLALKANALGVFVSQKDNVERVVLRIQPELAPYIKSVPVHESQKILEESHGELLTELTLIINPELEREILGYGEQAEVLKPKWLREKICGRAEQLLKKYLKINSNL